MVGNQDVIDATIDYFSDNILDGLMNQLQESEMYSNMIKLIKESDLQEDVQDELLQLYESGETADFLAKAFLYPVVGDNLKLAPDVVIAPVDEDIRIFKELVKKNHKKSTTINPPEDLKSQPKLERNFNNQRKLYYSAETIRRQLRDSDIGVTMNIYTHLEMIRMEELEQAGKEVDKTEGKKSMRQNMFKVV